MFKHQSAFSQKIKVSAPFSFSLAIYSKYWYIIVTAKRIPVPDPIAPIKSATTDKAPIHIPPKAAAVGMYLFNYFTIDSSLWPWMIMSYSINYLATSLALLPDTSIQILENKAQDPSTKTR